MISSSYCEIFKNIYFEEHLRMAASDFSSHFMKIYSQSKLNFKMNFLTRHYEGRLFTRRYVHFLAFERLVNKNFNQFLFWEIIFSPAKAKFFLQHFNTYRKTSSLNFLNFFPRKTSFIKSI